MSAHLKKLHKGNLKKETKYAVPDPIKKVKNKTKKRRVKEFKIYSIKKVFFNTS
tara:strand:+ start:247 stop:408 length:162 start_codon:yes stop_codon:yes gene_type:complete